jgi:Mn-dependent DtxR family transcriptional regulator
MKSEFQTFKKYLNKTLTASMEDYIEMIYRLSLINKYTRIQELANNLNVSTPSVTNMIQKLSSIGYIKYHKYGIIELEDKGRKLGKKLLERHNTLAQFLKIIGIDDKNILKETEKIEHTLSDESIKCIKKYIAKVGIYKE